MILIITTFKHRNRLNEILWHFTTGTELVRAGILPKLVGILPLDNELQGLRCPNQAAARPVTSSPRVSLLCSILPIVRDRRYLDLCAQYAGKLLSNILRATELHVSFTKWL